jgi:hypothetical protein
LELSTALCKVNAIKVNEVKSGIGSGDRDANGIAKNVIGLEFWFRSLQNGSRLEEGRYVLQDGSGHFLKC